MSSLAARPAARMSSLRPETHDQGTRGRLAFPGPLLLLFPLLAFAIGVARLQQRRPAAAGYPTAPSQGLSQAAEAWVGRRDATLSATLTRLHADEARQRFETAALRRRLDLGPGEPWRLELRYDPPGGSEATRLTLDELGVSDAEGLQLLALSAPPPPPRGGVADPVAVWFGQPATLDPARTATILLWGEEPGSNALLVGAGAEVLLWRGFHEVPRRGSLLAQLAETQEGEAPSSLDLNGSRGSER